MKLTPVKKLPGVLAFKRAHLVSDAEMFSRMPDGSDLPIPVVRHGIRGTQNVNDGKGNEQQKKASTDGTREISNIQQTETARLHPEATALVVRFGLSMLDLADSLDSCVAADKQEGRNMRDSVLDFIERAKNSQGMQQVALRYARNIANGRWLWRNRSIGAQITVIVNQGAAELARFDAKTIPMNQFDQASAAEQALAQALLQQMRGDSLEGLEITAEVTLPIRGSVEVFPSQNYIETKPKGFSRPLYKLGHAAARNDGDDNRVMGFAAMRDQKIFNAIRTIDTWYPAYADTGFPIAVEPLGASLSQQEFYRPGKASSFELFKRLALIDPDSDEGMFCIAAIDRGGVYGESDKNKAGE